MEHHEEISILNNQTIVEPTRGWGSLNLQAIWQYRELLYFLIWRDIKVRYKQAALGVTWIVLQPVLSMAIYSFLFGGLLHVPSSGVPYPLFAYAALLPWNYFSSSLTKSTISLVNSANLITKVYFPRMVIPIANVLSGLLDFAISFVVLIVLIAIYQAPLSPQVLLLPVFLILGILTALGFSLWLSALNVRYRDINYLIPFLVQIWMYATPVIYGSTLIPEQFRFILILNPMTAVVEGFRWALLGSQSANLTPVDFGVSVAITLVVLITGMVFFRRIEKSFADII